MVCVPGCSFQEGVLAGVLNVELGDELTELLLTVLLEGVHGCAGVIPDHQEQKQHIVV